MSKIISVQLSDDDLAFIDSLEGKTRTEKIESGLNLARVAVSDYQARIKSMRQTIEALNIPFDALGADYRGVRDQEGRDLLARLLQVKKKHGKKAVIDALNAECVRYGVERRGGSHKGPDVVQDSFMESEEQKAHTLTDSGLSRVSPGGSV